MMYTEKARSRELFLFVVDFDTAAYEGSWRERSTLWNL